MKTNLLNYDLNSLTRHFAEMGEKPFRAKQVMRWMHQAGAQNFDEMTDLAKSLRQKLIDGATIEVPKLMAAQESSDGTRKWHRQRRRNRVHPRNRPRYVMYFFTGRLCIGMHFLFYRPPRIQPQSYRRRNHRPTLVGE